jgi:putative flippase GtrA
MLETLLRPIPPEHRVVTVQMTRYAIAGLTITLAVAGSYWALAEFAGIDPMISLTLVYLVFSTVSYITHGSFSFKGHGERDRHHVRATRFVIVTIIGFCINQFFVWLLVKEMGGPTWWPTVPIIFVTPLVIFTLLRRYVYN